MPLAFSRSFGLPQPRLGLALALVIVAVACFAALDATTKLLTSHAPLMLVLWVRYLMMATLAVLPGLRHARSQGGIWPALRRHGRSRHPGLQVLRGLCLLACSFFAFQSLRHMPVGEFTAVVMLTPLAITAGAALWLSERVSLASWLCVLAGFGGALLVLRPGSSSGPSGAVLLLPCALVVANACYQVLTGRLVRAGEDASAIQMWTGLVGLAVTSLGLPWSWPAALSAETGWLLLLAGLFGLMGHQLLILAYRWAPAAALTPYLYGQIGFALLAGWYLFGDVPDALAWLGVGLIAAAGATGTWLAGHHKS